MGILLIVSSTFRLTNNNANGPAIAFAQQPCVDVVNVTLSGFPKQTADASTQVTLSPLRSHYEGAAKINVPGIGSDDVQVNLERSNDQILVHIPLIILSSMEGISSIYLQISLTMRYSFGFQINQNVYILTIISKNL